jgi:hypothetical protein
MKYATIDALSQVVTNICVWDGVTPFDPGAGLYLIQIQDGQLCDVGWSFDGSNFVPSNE